MKILFFILGSLLLSSVCADTELSVSKGQGSYVVKHLIKRVTGTSENVKGKIKCTKGSCEFLVASPVNSFISSDSNRDLNMMEITEAAKFPMTTAKGRFEEAKLSEKNWELPFEVSFHGISKTYKAKISGDKLKQKISFTLLLEDHSVKRPSLFGVEIDNEVPMEFDLVWKE
jgi:hypothetical protein